MVKGKSSVDVFLDSSCILIAVSASSRRHSSLNSSSSFLLPSFSLKMCKAYLQACSNRWVAAFRGKMAQTMAEWRVALPCLVQQCWVYSSIHTCNIRMNSRSCSSSSSSFKTTASSPLSDSPFKTTDLRSLFNVFDTGI